MPMPTKFPQTRKAFPSLFLFLPMLVLCLTLVQLLLPGEPLTGYRYTAAGSTPPASLRQLPWQENTTGERLTCPGGADMLLLEGTLPPGKVLLIPSFFGTVTPEGSQAPTHFSGSSWFLLAQSGSFSLRVHMPFLQTLQPRLLDQQQLQQLIQLTRVSMALGIVLLASALFPGPGKLALMMTGLYLILSNSFPYPEDMLPGWVFTAKLLYFSLCPLATLLSFAQRYDIPKDWTDLLVSFTMVYWTCLVYYHFDAFTQGLMLFGTILQLVILCKALFIRKRNRYTYAPAAYGALIAALSASVGFWLSLLLEASGSGWLMAAILTQAGAVPLMRLPAPASKRTPVQPSPSGSYPLYFADFEGILKKMGFDDATIARIDRKCNTSSHHMQHVAEYTRAICIAMGFSAEKTRQISCAALLHDIGKLEIPDVILFDPGKLTNEAFARIQSHNQLGHDLLQQRDGDFFLLAAEVALQHHERMDGTGYLKRKGEEISLPARIVAVADVFDALTSPRVYKRRWDFEAAFSHIVKNRGIHFDSKVVDDFIKCKPIIRKIYDSYTPHN